MTTLDSEQGSSLDDDLLVELEKASSQDPGTKTDAEVAPEVKTEVTPEPGAEAEAVQATVQEQIEALVAPTKWNKTHRDVFDAWGGKTDEGAPTYENGRDWQQSMLDLFGETQTYTTNVEQDRARIQGQLTEFQGFAHEWNEVLGPYQQMIAESGATPHVFARSAFGLAQALKNDPQATLLRLAKQSGIDLRKALEGQDWESPESRQIAEIRQELANERRARLQRDERSARQTQDARQAEVNRKVQTFADAKDESGKKLHPHVSDTRFEKPITHPDGSTYMANSFEELMAVQLRGDPNISLEDAYQNACKLHPDVTQASKAETSVTDAARKDAAAKKATDASVRVKAGTTGKEQPPGQSLKDELMEAVEKATA